MDCVGVVGFIPALKHEAFSSYLRKRRGFPYRTARVGIFTREVVECAESVESPVLVLEDLTYIRENMDYGEYMNRRLHGWGFAKLHAQIRYKAAEKWIPVETVNPRNTSKACHACGEHGYRPRQAMFRCSNDDCWLGEYQADVNGAINIADRYRSGESHRRSDRISWQKAGDDDSATDGASLTGPQDSQAINESRSDSFAHQKPSFLGTVLKTSRRRLERMRLETNRPLRSA